MEWTSGTGAPVRPRPDAGASAGEADDAVRSRPGHQAARPSDSRGEVTFVYICIPVHDEERTIGPVLWKIRETMAEYGRDYEVLVVDDASTDRTPEVLSRYTRVLPLTVHRCESRRGYAAALETALREAVRRSEYPKRDAVVTLQGDFTEDPGFIPELVKRIEGGADVVTSASAQDTRGASNGLRFARRAFEWLARRRDWPESLANPASGFRAYRVISLRKAVEERGDGPLMDRDGWLADLAMLRAVVPHARRVEEVEAPTRHERLQRPSRFDFKTSVRQVVGVVGSAPPREAAAETWQSVVHAPQPPADYARERSRGNGNGTGRRRANGSRPPGGRPQRSQAERRPRPSARPEAAPATEVEAKAPQAEDGAAAPRPQKRRKRPRRRGGSKKAGGAQGAAGGQDAGGQDAAAGQDAPSAPEAGGAGNGRPAAEGGAPQAGSADAQQTATGDGSAGQGRPRKRRGGRRRGGRGRGRGGQKPQQDGGADDASREEPATSS